MQLASRFASRSPSLRSDYPLSDDQIHRVAPSIFAEAPHESRSQRYAYIPTATVLTELRKEGFQPFMVTQTRLPADAAALAAQRGYLPTRIPLLKRVGAVAPQEVCVADGSVRIDGVPSAAVLRADRWGRPLPSWQQCRRLRPGELFLVSVTNPASFDSRYFGPVSAAAVIGVARPVWLESRP